MSSERDAYLAEVAAKQDVAARRVRVGAEAPAAHVRRRARAPREARLHERRDAGVPRRQEPRARSRRARAVDRLVAVLPHVGAVGPLSRDPRRSEEGRRRAQGVRRRPARCSRGSSRAAACARARPTASSPAAGAGDDIVVLSHDRAHELARFPMLRQQEDKDVCLSLADFIAPAGAGATTSARSSSPPGSAPTSSPAAFEQRPRRLQRDHGQGARRSARRGGGRVAAPPRARSSGATARPRA